MFVLQENQTSVTQCPKRPVFPFGEQQILLVGLPVTLGRNPDCTIVFPADDRTISRVHAVLELTETHEGLFEVVISEKSSFGTTVNGLRLTKNRSVPLKPGDTVAIGSYYQLVLSHEELEVICAQFGKECQQEVDTSVNRLGGSVVTNFNQSTTHLCCTSLNLTPKICRALIFGLRFVSPEYFHRLVAQADSLGGTREHKPTDFASVSGVPNMPNLDVDLTPNPARRHLFREKIFYCFKNSQKEKFGPIIQWADGNCELVFDSSDADLSQSLTKLRRPGAVLMHVQRPSFSGMSKEQQKLVSKLILDWRKRGLREIRDKEIAFAILEASTELYCNPETKQDSVMDQSLNSQAQDLSNTQLAAVSASAPNLASKSHCSDNFIQPPSPKRRRKSNDQIAEAVSSVQNATSDSKADVQPNSVLGERLPSPSYASNCGRGEDHPSPTWQSSSGRMDTPLAASVKNVTKTTPVLFDNSDSQENLPSPCGAPAIQVGKVSETVSTTPLAAAGRLGGKRNRGGSGKEVGGRTKLAETIPSVTGGNGEARGVFGVGRKSGGEDVSDVDLKDGRDEVKEEIEELGNSQTDGWFQKDSTVSDIRRMHGLEEWKSREDDLKRLNENKRKEEKDSSKEVSGVDDSILPAKNPWSLDRIRSNFEFVSLRLPVVDNRSTRMSNQTAGTANYKRFQKAPQGCHVSPSVIPKVIGLSDLKPHTRVTNRRGTQT